MIDFTCSQEFCENKGIKNTFLGNPKQAICAGCDSILVGTDERPDAEITKDLEI
jgi:hypothetical protein